MIRSRLRALFYQVITAIAPARVCHVRMAERGDYLVSPCFFFFSSSFLFLSRQQGTRGIASRDKLERCETIDWKCHCSYRCDRCGSSDDFTSELFAPTYIRFAENYRL